MSKKNTFKILFSLLFSLGLTGIVSAQKATLRGQMIEAETGDPIPFANIYIEEIASGDVTDLDGYFTFSLDPGIYNLTFSYVGFSDKKVSNLNLEAGAEEVLKIMMTTGVDLDEVVVVAEQTRNSLIGVTTIRRKSNKLLDALPSEIMKAAGDSDAGEAIKRVTGVSIEGGKHVFVRGLGDRYTKTTLNGLEIPGLDPDRNSVEMDIFPTNLIENIIVYKTFAPDLSADFTGGSIDISTKAFPDRKTISASLSAGFNPNMHFNSNFLTQQTGSLDGLGFDDGSRALPFHPSSVIPDNSSAQADALPGLTGGFSSNMAAIRQRNNLNKSASFALGNQFTKMKTTIGYNLSLSYKNNSTFYEGAQFNNYRYDADNSIQNLLLTTTRTADIAESNTFWSAMGGFSAKIKEHKISVNVLRLQNGVGKASKAQIDDVFENPSVLIADNLEYAQREITNVLVKGAHSFKEGKQKLEWGFSPTFIEVDEPDIRSTTFLQSDVDGELIFAPSVGAEASRTFRNLTEQTYNGKVDYTMDFNIWNEATSKLKVGANILTKSRLFSIQNYLVRIKNQGALNIAGNPDALFASENIWTPEAGAGTFIKGNYQPANAFSASQTVIAGYALNELPISTEFKVTYGARVEKVDNYYTGQNNFGTKVYRREKVLDDLDVLPSLNMVYSLSSQMNLRGSYNRTLARPSFKEKSIAQIQDRITGRTFLGNIDLVSTKVDNYDLRWEMFAKKGQSVSVSGFYKGFINPIELTVFDATAPDSYQPINVGDASILGLEIEGRKTFDFISPALSDLSISANVTIVKSSVAMRETEFEARTNAAREGQVIESNRQMVGQSPYIINAMLNYKGKDSGIEANMSYNVQGERLAIAGIGLIPDIYERPFHALNIKIGKSFGGETKPWNLSASVENILNSKRQQDFRAFDESDGIFQNLNPGRLFTVGFSYSL